MALGPAMSVTFSMKMGHISHLLRNIARIPAAGRNWESFGGDPYLSGEAAFEVSIQW